MALGCFWRRLRGLKKNCYWQLVGFIAPFCLIGIALGKEVKKSKRVGPADRFKGVSRFAKESAESESTETFLIIGGCVVGALVLGFVVSSLRERKLRQHRKKIKQDGVGSMKRPKKKTSGKGKPGETVKKPSKKQ